MKKLLLTALALVIITSLIGSCGSGSMVPAGNISNYGYVLLDGNNLFYTKVVMTDFGYFSNIYRLNLVSQAETLVARMEVDFPNEMNAFLTMHNGYLYFLPYFLHESMKEVSPNIYRVRPDGVNVAPEPLFETPRSIAFMQIVNGLIYFYDEDAGEMGALFSMRPDGTDIRLIADAPMDSISIGGGNVYFTDHDVIRSVSLRGGAIRDVFDFSAIEDEVIFPRDIIVYGNYIYFSDDSFSRIGRVRTNGRNHQIIYTVSEDSLEFMVYFNVSGNTVFMVMENYGIGQNSAILSVPTRGGTPSVVVSDAEHLGYIFPISIWGGRIYLNGMTIYDTLLGSQCGFVWFSVGTGGGGRLEPFMPFSIFDPDFDLGWDDEDDEYDEWDDD